MHGKAFLLNFLLRVRRHDVPKFLHHFPHNRLNGHAAIDVVGIREQIAFKTLRADVVLRRDALIEDLREKFLLVQAALRENGGDLAGGVAFGDGGGADVNFAVLQFFQHGDGKHGGRELVFSGLDALAAPVNAGENHEEILVADDRRVAQNFGGASQRRARRNLHDAFRSRRGFRRIEKKLDGDCADAARHAEQNQQNRHELDAAACFRRRDVRRCGGLAFLE